MMKKIFVVAVVVAMVLLFALPCLFGWLSAKEKIPSPRDDGTEIFVGAEKIGTSDAVFVITLRNPVDTSVVYGSVNFEWNVRQNQTPPGDPITYIVLNGRKF